MSDAFSAISWSSMSSALVMLEKEGSSSAALFSITACRAVTFPLGMSKPKLRSQPLPNISTNISTNFSTPLVVKAFLLPR